MAQPYPLKETPLIIIFLFQSLSLSRTSRSAGFAGTFPLFLARSSLFRCFRAWRGSTTLTEFHPANPRLQRPELGDV